jgi:hypothetical protein
MACVLYRDAVVERPRAPASLEFDSYDMADQAHDLSARADQLPLSPSSMPAVSHERRQRGGTHHHFLCTCRVASVDLALVLALAVATTVAAALCSLARGWLLRDMFCVVIKLLHSNVGRVAS